MCEFFKMFQEEEYIEIVKKVLFPLYIIFGFLKRKYVFLAFLQNLRKFCHIHFSDLI